MFPSVGLFTKIGCPFRDKCGRGSLCLFDHRPPVIKKPQQQQQPLPAPIRQVQETNDNKQEKGGLSGRSTDNNRSFRPSSAALAPREAVQPETDASITSRSVAITAAAVKAEPVSKRPTAATQHADAKNSGTAETAETVQQESSALGTDSTGKVDWRQLTLNYDASGPAFDASTESQPVAPQLKATVGERVGYGRRQKSLEMLYERYLQATDAATLEKTPWLAAKQAVESEAEVYASSGAGTYHSKLLVCLREIKRQK